jgi:23S rRNA pseudouridine1911/1915/1917 synthase
MIIKRPGIVHRLDRDTSGAMVVARTQEFFDFMKKQFQDHLVQKSYRAYVYGHMKHDTGVIDAPIGRSRTDIRQWSATRGARGNMREAITEYKVLARGHDEAGEKYSYVEFRPRTGRTHQIRVHAKYMNYPIVGDALYAGKLIDRGNLGFQRQALHACSLSFSDEEENRHDYTASFPDDFLRAEILFKNV